MNKPAAVIVKHNNPSGVAYGSTIAEAYSRAFRADRIAAFGGCAALNRAVDKETAELMSELYLEVVAAPDYTGDALDILKKKKNLRIVKIERIDNLEKYKDLRFVDFKSLNRRRNNCTAVPDQHCKNQGRSETGGGGIQRKDL